MTRATFFIGSLKADAVDSNTAKVCMLAKKELEEYGVNVTLRYLRNKRIAHGVDFQAEEPWDQMKSVYEDIYDSDIIVAATPVWWGIHSSIIQQWMERVGAYDDKYIKEGRSPLYNKVFGSVITASNDGFQHAQGILCAFATNMGMTVPPESVITWGTALTHSKSDTDPRKNEETMNMVKNACRNWYLWSTVIKHLDLGNVAQDIKPGKVGLLSSDKLARS